MSLNHGKQSAVDYADRVRGNQRTAACAINKSPRRPLPKGSVMSMSRRQPIWCIWSHL
jgi:hypothetical protein